ncbi:MAG: HEPN domain-containing protein [Lachnospiraceae bacterium]
MNGNYRQTLRDCEVELNSIQQWIDSNRLDSNVRFLTSYSVIKACGTVEYVFKQIVYDYLSSGANEEAKTYLNKSIIEASFNPSTGQMYRILEKINSDWRVGFENLIKGSSQMGQLNSLVKLRNSFAHGSAITASINDVKSYYNAGIWILEKLCEVMA